MFTIEDSAKLIEIHLFYYSDNWVAVDLHLSEHLKLLDYLLKLKHLIEDQNRLKLTIIYLPSLVRIYVKISFYDSSDLEKIDFIELKKIQLSYLPVIELQKIVK